MLSETSDSIESPRVTGRGVLRLAWPCPWLRKMLPTTSCAMGRPHGGRTAGSSWY